MAAAAILNLLFSFILVILLLTFSSVQFMSPTVQSEGTGSCRPTTRNGSLV